MGGGGLGLCRVTGPPHNGSCTRMSGTCVTCVTCVTCADFIGMLQTAPDKGLRRCLLSRQQRRHAHGQHQTAHKSWWQAVRGLALHMGYQRLLPQA